MRKTKGKIKETEIEKKKEKNEGKKNKETKLKKIEKWKEKTKTEKTFLCFSSFLPFDNGLNCKIRGLRVTIPEPRGRKSRPTTFSKTLLLPLLCLKKEE